MTARAVLLGLAGAAAVCGLTYVNDYVLRQTFLVGNFMPISVFGGLILFLLAVNPLLFRWSGRAALKGKEIAVIVALTLAACYVPGRGLGHYFTTFLMLPRHYVRVEPGWKEQGVVDMAPRRMLAGVAPEFRLEHILDLPGLCSKLEGDGARDTPGPSRRIWQLLPERTRAVVREAARTPPADEAGKLAVVEELVRELVKDLNGILRRRDFHRHNDFAGLALPEEATELLSRERRDLSGEDVRRLNRHLIDSAYPREVLSLDRAMESCTNAFVMGLREGDEHIGLSQVPWHVWGRTLLFWVPLLLAMAGAVIGLALVVHRQWSDHEQLPYPIARFAHSLLPAEGESRGGVFTNRLFWIGALIVLAIHMNNYAKVWWPEYLVAIPRRFSFLGLRELFPTFSRGHGSWTLMQPIVFFTGVGFAYLLTTDVSLSLGLAPFAYALVTGIFMAYGVPFGGRVFALAIGRFICAGAYFGFFLVLVYTGRRYFMSVFRRSVGLRSADPVEPHAVWGARVFLAGSALFVLMLVREGMALYLALLYTFGALILFLVLSRIVAETGVFFVNVPFSPCIVLWGLLGAKAIGPRACLMIFMVSSLLLIDPREALMPFIATGLKLVDMSKVKLGRTAGWGAAAVALGLAVALTVTLYVQHDRGAMEVSDGWTAGRPNRRGIPRNPFDAVVGIKQRLAAQGELGAAGGQSGAAWFGSLSPNVPCLVGFGVAVGLVILFTACRLRFPRWPFHPVMFLVLSAWSSQMLAASFLLGWLAKTLTLRFGGARGAEKLKPLMFGLIAGDMLGGVIPMIIGAIHYAITNQRPPASFMVTPW
ncbi:MAG: DUF6785 family protein [Planctomycetota bacterium]|jgi:hypothetical protein